MCSTIFLEVSTAAHSLNFDFDAHAHAHAAHTLDRKMHANESTSEDGAVDSNGQCMPVEGGLGMGTKGDLNGFCQMQSESIRNKV